ncbi:MAG: lipoprotein signal peptidase [Paludibacteraceae bacterium]|nr:lipoprotein signal peptidase [Paludibacteraceae bacterium]
MKNRTLTLSLSVTAIVLISLIIDQIIKLYVATHFALGESHEVTSWFWLCFIENNGMAFGLEWMPKIALTLFRLIAVALLGWYTHTLIRRPETPVGYIITIAFIIAGATGNIIDCVCYGKLFGYADWFYGKVVDMFYFPLWTWPDWLPFLGGQVFFRPVFNFADSCITVAVFVILFFYSKQLSSDTKKKDQAPIEEK